MNVSTTFANQIHPLTGLHQSLWLGVVPTLSRDDKSRAKIINALREHGGISKYRIVRVINMTPEGVDKHLGYLMATDVVSTYTGCGIDGRGNKKLYSLKGAA